MRPLNPLDYQTPEAYLEAIDGRMDEWHAKNANVVPAAALSSALGLTEEEYGDFIRPGGIDFLRRKWLRAQHGD